MKINQKQLDAYTLVSNRLQEIAEDYRDSFLNNGYYVNRVYIENEDINIVYEYTCYGHGDYESVSIPLSYIFKEDWFSVERQRRADEKKAKEEAENARYEAKKIQEKEKRHQQFLALKQEFEGETK